MDKRALELAERAARETAETMGYQFYSIRAYKENGTTFLEVCVDKDYSVTLEQIEAYSQALGERLDTIEELDEPYTLDVASPGAERDFPKEDLTKVVGRYVEVETNNLPKGEKKAEGTIESFDGKTLVLKRFIKGRKKVYQIPYDDVVKCRFKVRI